MELIVVGDELLSGRVVDTNSAFAGRALAGIGLTPRAVTRVGDSEADIKEAVARAAGRADVVLVIGGLGPTPDDRTTAAVAGICSVVLVSNRALLARVRRLFSVRGMRMPKLSARQALVPCGASLLPNPVGVAPGMVLERRGSILVMLPGVPAEMQAIFTAGVLPLLRRRFPAAALTTLVVRSLGISESAIAELVGPWSARNPRVEVSYYPSTSGVDVVLRGDSRVAVLRGQRRIAALLGRHVYATGDEPLEAVVGRLLLRKRLTVATAESCTGGMVAARITDVPGSSRYYRGTVVSYANDIKTNVLGVNTGMLAKRGAVNRETARAMAAGVCRLTDADVGVAVTGVAGPGGGTKREPVGTVCIHVKLGRRHAAETFRLAGNRAQVRERAASAALDLCRRALQRTT